MWLDWLVICDCGFSLSTLWCPLSVPAILVGFLLPWMWGISSPLLPLPLYRGYLLSSAAPDLVRGVYTQVRRSWPWTWGISSQRLTAPALRSQDFIKYNSPMVFLIAFWSWPSLWKFSVVQEGSPALSLSLSLLASARHSQGWPHLTRPERDQDE